MVFVIHTAQGETKMLPVDVVFALIISHHLPETEKNSFYHCNEPIFYEIVTCPNQILLVRGNGQAGYSEDCLRCSWATNIEALIRRLALAV